MAVTVTAVAIKQTNWLVKFYNREKECEALREIETLSAEDSQMTVMIGRRRIGKTTLLKRELKKTPTRYFFIAKKNGVLLCEEFVLEINEKLAISLGRFDSFAQLFKALMIHSMDKNFTVIIDEFQEFSNINSSVFSDV